MDNAVISLRDVPQVEPSIVTSVFWGDVPPVVALDVGASIVVESKKMITDALMTADPVLNSFLATYRTPEFMDFFLLDINTWADSIGKSTEEDGDEEERLPARAQLIKVAAEHYRLANAITPRSV